MTGDIVCINGPFSFVLDFKDVSGADLGVAARIRIEYAGTRQRFAWTLEQCWFEYEELNKFEVDLRDSNVARLHDMSGYPVLHLERGTAGEYVTINPPSERQSTDGEAIATRLHLDSGAMHGLYESMKQFPKWW